MPPPRRLTPVATKWALQSASNGGAEPQTEETPAPAPPSGGFKLPSAFGILSGLICTIAALTWIVPAVMMPSHIDGWRLKTTT
eukprot:6051257-Pyramimonas_sp.AAC.1